jgi:hypothetical protein
MKDLCCFPCDKFGWRWNLDTLPHCTAPPFKPSINVSMISFLFRLVKWVQHIFRAPKLLFIMFADTRFNVPHSTSIQRKGARKKVLIIAICSLDSNTRLQTSVSRYSCHGYFYLRADRGARWALHMLRHWSFIFWPCICVFSWSITCNPLLLNEHQLHFA